MDKKPKGKNPKDAQKEPSETIAFSFKHKLLAAKRDKVSTPNSKAFHKTIHSILELHQQESINKKKHKPKS